MRMLLLGPPSRMSLPAPPTSTSSPSPPTSGVDDDGVDGAVANTAAGRARHAAPSWTAALMLRCADLAIEVPGRVLCRNVSLAFQPGEVWAVLGRNGAGSRTGGPSDRQLVGVAAVRASETGSWRSSWIGWCRSWMRASPSLKRSRGLPPETMAAPCGRPLSLSSHTGGAKP